MASEDQPDPVIKFGWFIDILPGRIVGFLIKYSKQMYYSYC